MSAKNQYPDHALREQAHARTQYGTYLAPNAPAGALLVRRGTGALGTGQDALVVNPGSAFVRGTKHTVSAEQNVDISGGDGQPRRDVVFLDENTNLAVIEGEPMGFDWDNHLTESEKNITNAYRPPPPDMDDVAGFPLAYVTVGENSGTLSTGAITELRFRAPASVTATANIETGVVDGATLQSSLDGRVVAVAPGHGVTDAIDPAATPTPVGDAVALVEAAGGGQVILPPEPVENASRIDIDTSQPVNIIGTGWRRSEVIFTDTSDHGFVIHPPSNPPVAGVYWHNFTIHGHDVTQRAKDATSAMFFKHSPKDFNIGALAFREWNGTVISGGSGDMAYGATWNHLAFGYGESNNRGTLLELHGQGAPLRIGQFHAATSTTDPLITTDRTRHVYLDIGTMNIGGSAGPIIDITGGSYSIIDIGLVNFEPGGATMAASHAVKLKGECFARFGPFLQKTGELDDVFVLDNKAKANIGLVPHADVSTATLNNAVVRVADAGARRSFYHGPAADIDYGGFGRQNVIPLAEPHTVPTPTVGPITSDYTADYGEIILCDTSGNNVTVTLPPVADGARVSPQNIDSSGAGDMFIETPGGATIDGTATDQVGSAGAGRELVCDGSDWWSVN